ncbi:MAG: bifunctional folylpolyglutamate synthase/dihydrofolate synthase [Candidatus Riflebacteria bacterium]|nr:bifunctional folylpolyglutamate synthase/dihydrofolate synthase [Candidatus Riflebacteria bacterium]
MTFDYFSALSFFGELSNREILPNFGGKIESFNLDPLKRLLEALGHPENKFPSIHIAGTKGKGSIAAMTASILKASGRKVGLYTSPHFSSIRERIVINSEMISKEDFAATTKAIKHSISGCKTDCPSHFEVLTALAFLYFAGQQVDIAVIETGLGGTYDSTNVITPFVSVISSISLDHTSILGNTLSEIALHKAGIIKENGILVSAPQKPEVLSVFRDVCKARSARIEVVQTDLALKSVLADLQGQSFEIKDLFKQTLDKRFRLPLLGEHQVENACVAIKTIETLNAAKMNFTPEQIFEGLQKVVWPGRFQILSTKPVLIADGAHNPYSAAALRKTLNQFFGARKSIFIIGVSCDKDVRGIIENLIPESKVFIATRSGHPRSLKPEMIAEIVSQLGGHFLVSENIDEALETAKKMVGNQEDMGENSREKGSENSNERNNEPIEEKFGNRKICRNESNGNEVICVTGSLFLVGEILKKGNYLSNNNNPTK